MIPSVRNYLNISKILNLITNSIKSPYLWVFLIYLLPRVIGLGADISDYDASYWHPRSENFVKHLFKGEYAETYQKYHPGVLLMWASGLTKWFFVEAFKTVFHYDPTYVPHQYPRFNFASKFPLVTLISISGVFIYYYLRKVTNSTFAVIFSVILSLEPFFLGVSRFFHLSALTSILAFLSFTSLYYHYQSTKGYKHFVVSAIALGLGSLTKIDALIAAPVLGSMILFYEYRQSKNLLQPLRNGLLYAGICIATFWILFPAMWVMPFRVLKMIYSGGIEETAFSSSGAPTISGIKYLFYPETFVFRSLVTTTISLIFGVILAVKYTKSNNTTFSKSLIYWMAAYGFLSMILLTIPDKIKDRYFINLYPAFLFFSSIAFYWLLQSPKRMAKILLGIVVFYYVLTAYRYYPVYSYYYSEIIGGPEGLLKAGLPVKNRGEWYAQAAQYINQTADKPEEKNVVISHREQMRTFPRFFYGKTYTNPKFVPDGQFTDYIVTRVEFEDLVPPDKCTYVKGIGPRAPMPYYEIRIYKCEGLDNSYMDYKN